MSDRIQHKGLKAKVMSAEAAAAMIPNGAVVGASGFTGAGYPKAVPIALAKRAVDERLKGKPFKVNLLTGASTGPELDQVMGLTESVAFRFPYNGDAVMREKFNAGVIEYQDMHLSHAGSLVRYGYYGRPDNKIDFALIEVTKIREDGSVIFSSSVGANTAYLEVADKIILEVCEWQDERLEGMHDVFSVPGQHGERGPIPVLKADDRVGSPYCKIDVSKVAAVVMSNYPDRNAPFKAPEADHKRIAQHILDFLDGEVKGGRLPKSLTPLQSGVGNIANAVLVGLNEGHFENMTSYTEVIQDGMLDLLDSGKLRIASATAFSVSPAGQERFNKNIERYRKQIILRPQDVSNHPEVIRRLGCIAMNGFVEADIYGHVNSTHIVGKGIENGIGGSGDFARNSAYTIFMSPSVAKNGAISAIVPFATHIDHTEHDVSGIVTEYGFADLRGKSPKQKAKEIIEKCAHPDYRPLLNDYLKRSLANPSAGKHSPHMFEEAFGFHNRYLKTGDMRPKK
ncbi:acetyl-CoA hydrolase/transferase family protein [Anaeromyxobacter sp. Fw109-5]|uniref:acetyl-CoA hydrolase/transferase family protein n=1 Tax=Anaeromyxobacter sp. (strain Fw109-5) TaxID=404589 RepID=UPI0000ED74A2|nr:acetyl-CoA hydrolase/transferase family protein [Anaeromyxobacter sp. Fw109-5]ABS26678.1 Acetyl-CoA hydrolase [Anaeromyxobacter sp. Fw109-5]